MVTSGISLASLARPAGTSACGPQVIDHFRIFGPESDIVAPAGAFQRVVNDIRVRFPILHHLVEAIALEVVDEFDHPRLIQQMAVEVARGVGHLEVDQRAVGVEGHVFRAEAIHG